MEITVLCKDMTVSTPYKSEYLHVTLDEVEAQKVANELIHNELEGVDIHQLLDAIGVDDVSEWLNRKGYFVTDGDGDA